VKIETKQETGFRPIELRIVIESAENLDHLKHIFACWNYTKQCQVQNRDALEKAASDIWRVLDKL